jgi:hypothetical protein
MSFVFELRGCLKITYFTQFLRCQKNLILKILCVFLKVKFFFRLELEQTKQFSNSLLGTDDSNTKTL